jgi:hypothetical protein
MEHGIYHCTWTRSPDGFVLWVKARPHVRGSGPTYAHAEQRLIAAIQDAGGAVQAVLEFNPPLPRSAAGAGYATPEIYLVAGDDRFETNAPRWKWSESAAELDGRLRWNDAFYDAPVCRRCRFTAGRRSDKPLTLTYASSRYDGAFGSVGTDGGPTHLLVSDEFLALLTPAERGNLELRPAVRRGRRKFYELTGPDGPPLVAVAGLPLSGWRCPACDYRLWGCPAEDLATDTFVARSDLPAPLPSVFTVGISPEIQLAVTAPRWKELAGRKGTRGFASHLLGVVPDGEVVRRPDLPSREEPRRAAGTTNGRRP